MLILNNLCGQKKHIKFQSQALSYIAFSIFFARAFFGLANPLRSYEKKL